MSALWIAHVTVTDEEAYSKYAALANTDFPNRMPRVLRSWSMRPLGLNATILKCFVPGSSTKQVSLPVILHIIVVGKIATHPC